MRVPLLYKAGILRDGTPFQDEYCIDGQWIRFVGGKIKKMKGQQALLNSPDFVIYMSVVPDGNTTHLYYATPNAVHRMTLDLRTYTLSNDTGLLTNNVNVQYVSWSSTLYTANTVPFIAFLRTLNAQNMLNDRGGELYVKQLDGQPLELRDIGDNRAIASGGILFSNPCLYIYGNNGTILRSRTTDPLSFDGGDSGVYTISTEKLIFGAAVRGGSNAPSFLFWTASSVIYLTNISTGNVAVDFQKEVVTNNSSLMSSRAIVQYDSLFFWLGTDRIFVYNGIVDSIPNTINLEYFFDNVDLNKRQKIFGYKIARYGEVRWAYPEKRFADNAQIGCTRELVYNVRENSWYDTVIQRDCVTVYEGTGDIFSYGDSCTNYRYENAPRTSIWKHEVGTTEVSEFANRNIPSFFTTPYYGFVTFNPAKTGGALDKYIVLDQIEPDFPTQLERTDADQIIITVSYKKYASYNLVTTDPVIFKLADLPAQPNLGKIDFRIQGRFMGITFYCEYPYDVGTVLLNFKEGDNQ
jgi:hypothetical protein